MSGSQAGVVIYGLDRDSHSTNRTMTALMAGDVSDRPQGLTGCHLPNDRPQC
jgi:hypothetical protein